MKGLLCFVVVLFVLCPMARSASFITGYNSNLHDRFDSTSFIASAFDLTGVARADNNAWATMLNSEYFISANHFHPAIGQSVTFYEGNSSSSATVIRSVASGVRLFNTDLWIGRLSTPVPSSIKSYTIASNIVNLSSTLGSYADQVVYQVGLRAANTVGGTTNFVVGLNNIEIGDSSAPALVGLGDFNAVGFVFDIATSPADVNRHDPGELGARIGDSGAPSFIVSGGNFLLVGTHSYVLSSLPENSVSFPDFVESQSPNSPYQKPSNQTREVTYDNFVPNYRADILAIIPEPSTVALLVLAGLGAAGVTSRRRSRAKPAPCP